MIDSELAVCLIALLVICIMDMICINCMSIFVRVLCDILKRGPLIQREIDCIVGNGQRIVHRVCGFTIICMLICISVIAVVGSNGMIFPSFQL